MKFGLAFASSIGIDHADALEVCRHAAAAGLAFAAAAAPGLRLGTCILIVPQRNPIVLAKELATLDQLSGGRVELGVGVGWLREEFDALGIPWERRGARTDEYLAAMRELWAGPHAEFHGDYVDSAARPKPPTATPPASRSTRCSASRWPIRSPAPSSWPGSAWGG